MKAMPHAQNEVSPPMTDQMPQFDDRPILLVADDEEGSRASVRLVLKDLYNVLLVDNGRDAIELAKKHHISAAILDIRMGAMSGIDVLNGLKSVDPTIEVIMLTAYETLETARQALRLGACDYLTKPFEIPTLRQAVGTAMERHGVARAMRETNSLLTELQRDIEQQKFQQEVAESKSEIYSHVIHDINGPLTVISGFIESINQKLTDAKSLEGEKLDQLKDRLSRITRQVTNCVQMSRRYLGFLRASRSEEATAVSANEILADLKNLLWDHNAVSKHELTVEPFSEDVLVEADGTELIQILLNLTINACHASSKDGSSIAVRGRLHPEPVDIRAWTDRPGSRFINPEAFANKPPVVVFEISDHGSGIPPEILPRLFEPYVTATSPGRGTGLGLSIVRRLVEHAHGGIGVQTEAGKGTTFSVCLQARAGGG